MNLNQPISRTLAITILVGLASITCILTLSVSREVQNVYTTMPYLSQDFQDNVGHPTLKK